MPADPLAIARDLIRCPRCTTARPGPGVYCAVIVKRVDEKTRAKTSINELLRD
jgi:2,3,4,5-tetrahydropyridine-2-carboxylate N-succinyltransferase